MGIFSVFGKVEDVFKSIAAAWPLVDSFVKQIEAAIPDAVGSLKLSSVKSMLQAAWGDVEGVVVDFESAWPAISSAVGALVTVYNTVGLFHHTAAAPTAATPPAAS